MLEPYSSVGNIFIVLCYCCAVDIVNLAIVYLRMNMQVGLKG